MNGSVPLVALLGTVLTVWPAAWIDLQSFRIPNTLVVAGAGVGFLTQVWESGLDGLWMGLAGLGLGLAFFLPGYFFRAVGAGDVKLMGAVGALLGPERVALALLCTVLAGGTVAAIYAVSVWATKGARGPFRRYGGMLKALWVTGRASYVPAAPDEALAQRFPFALPIALGSTAAALWPL